MKVSKYKIAIVQMVVMKSATFLGSSTGIGNEGDERASGGQRGRGKEQ